MAFLHILMYNQSSIQKIGEINMFSQLFGKYLVDKDIISRNDYLNAIREQLAVRVKLGTIAVSEGFDGGTGRSYQQQANAVR